MLKVVYAASEGVREGVPATDRGLAYGDGLFETVRMCGQRAVLRRHHLKRMVSDAGRLGIEVGYDELDQRLGQAAAHLEPDAGAESWVLKMILTRGAGGRGYRLPEQVEPRLIVSAAAMPPSPDPGGVVARLASFPLTVNPRLAGIKTLNRLEQVMASREFTGAEWELIMTNTAGEPVEGTRTNLLARVGEEWITPPVLSIAVAGVMRQYAIECLRAASERVAERPLPRDFVSLPEFRGLYLLNSVSGLMPVGFLDSVQLPVDDTLATICNPLETLE